MLVAMDADSDGRNVNMKNDEIHNDMHSMFDNIGREELKDKISITEMVEKIDELIAEFDRRDKERSIEEDKILMKIKDTLEEHHVEYIFDEVPPKLFEISFDLKNKPYTLYIILHNGKIIFKLVFPFRIQCSSLALVSLYMAQFNKEKSFSVLNLDMEDGELSMEYTYLLSAAEEFNQKQFWIYMTLLIFAANEVYVNMQYLSVGKVTKSTREYYMLLLEKSLGEINGDAEDAIFGGSEKSGNINEKVETFLNGKSKVSEDTEKDYIHYIQTESEEDREISTSFKDLIKMSTDALVSDEHTQKITDNTEQLQKADELLIPFKKIEIDSECESD